MTRSFRLPRFASAALIIAPPLLLGLLAWRQFPAARDLVFGVQPTRGTDGAALWHLACGGEDGHSCVVEQFALRQPGNIPVLHVRFSREQDRRDQTRMTITVPNDVSRQEGVRFALGGGTQIAVPILRCGGEGCDAPVIFDRSAVARVESAKQLTVRYAVGAAPAESYPIQLDGLADALASLPD